MPQNSRNQIKFISKGVENIYSKPRGKRNIKDIPKVPFLDYQVCGKNLNRTEHSHFLPAKADMCIVVFCCLAFLKAEITLHSFVHSFTNISVFLLALRKLIDISCNSEKMAVLVFFFGKKTP